MKRLLAVCAVVGLVAIACAGRKSGGNGTPTPTPSGSPTPVVGPVSVTALDGTGAPQGGVDVFVESSSGTLLQSLVTSASGIVIAQNVLAGSMVTVGRPGLLANEVTVQTITGVVPGDSIRVTPPTLTYTATSVGSMTVNVPAFGGATSYVVQTVCGATGSGTTAVVLNLSSNCLSPANKFDLIAFAYDMSGLVIAYEPMTNVLFSNAGTVNVATWTNPATISASFTSAPATSSAVTFLAYALNALGSIPLMSESLGAPGPYDFSAASAPLNVLASHEQTAFVHFPQIGSYAASSSLTWDGNGAIDTDLATNALPIIQSATLDTSTGFTRASVLIATTAGALADAVQVDASWTSASHRISWSAFGPGTARTFGYPELPSTYQIAPGDTPLVQAAMLVESTVWPGYDAFRAAPVTATPYIPAGTGRHRLSLFVYQLGFAPR